MAFQLRTFFSVDQNNSKLLQAQLAAFSKQIPLLYFMLLTNTVALTITHFSSAPPLLTVYFPSVLYVACILRIIGWWRTRKLVVSDAAAAKRLRSTIVLTGILGIGFTGWAISLFPYGNTYAQVHVAFYMGITVVGCIFCLTHLRPAALLLTAVVLVPFTLFFGSTGNPVFIAITVNVVFVSVALIIVVSTQYRDFTHLIESQKALETKQLETQRLSDENRRLANVDSLTGLPNRRHFLARFESDLEEARLNQTPLTIGIIDLDGFKPVNDAFGHTVGDKLLQEAGRRLMDFSGEGVFAARLGGDEFGLIIEGDLPVEALGGLGNRICQALRQPYSLTGATATVAGSLGLARFPEAGRSAGQLFERADFALYHAKQNLRGQTVVFSEEHELEISRQSRIDQQLKSADLECELSVAFQPFVDSFTGEILGFEALARWDSPAMGRIPPNVFILSAERTGMIGQLTEIVFRKALDAALQWPEGIRLSFNLSCKDIVSPETMKTLMDILEKSGFPAGRLDFEVTETAVVDNFQLASEALNLLIAKGIGVALDDFGIGQSGLAHVHRLPLSKIKIDRSFLAGIQHDTVSQNIVKTIVDLCRNLGCVCVVEGMETQDQVHVLRTLGCRIMQGYYFDRPLMLEETLARFRPVPAPGEATLLKSG